MFTIDIRWARSAINGYKYCMTGQKMKKKPQNYNPSKSFKY